MDELKPLGLSFIHFSVINEFAEESFGPFKSLAESIIIYSLPREKDSSARSRDFGLCIANALHFYFSNQGASFQLRPICRAIRPSSKETIFDLALVPLPSIQQVDEDAIKITPITIGSDIFEPRLEGANPELISELAPGVYFSSVSKSDELLAILQVEGSNKKAAIIFEMNDCLKPEPGNGSSMIAHWRGSQQLLRFPGEMPPTKSPELGDMGITVSHQPSLQKMCAVEQLKKAGFEVGFILLGADRQTQVDGKGEFSDELVLLPQSDLIINGHLQQLRSDEALMDLEHMQEWFPTVGFSVLAAHKIKQLLNPELANVELPSSYEIE